jgi:hypothetical protein
MPSILLSFVGQQDPVSDTTREDGSIVSLLRHLVDQQNVIKQVVLLYTTGANGTQARAELTQGWLADAPFNLKADRVESVPVGNALSHDPVNVELAVQAARRGLELALGHCNPQDTLELNASSGTPVMKSAWGILQAAGYAPKSRLWQVRNPKEQRPGQARVFESNMQGLRQEFDRKVIQQQLRDYTYNGALATLQAAGLASPGLVALLTYGYCRLSLDFARAQAAIAPYPTLLAPRWLTEISALVQRNPQALLREAYFNVVVELKNQQFSNALVRVSQFQEMALRLFVTEQLGGSPALPKTYEATADFWHHLRAEHGTLYQFLQGYQFRDKPLRLEGFPNRPHYQAMLEYGAFPALAPLNELTAYCEQRNRYIHEFGGISALEGADAVLRAMRQVLEHRGETDFNNPFNAINSEVLALLEHGLLSTHTS